jgi:hypothetical protein
MHAHFTRNMGQNNVPVVELYPKHGVWERLYNVAVDFNYFLCIGHKLQLAIIDICWSLVKGFVGASTLGKFKQYKSGAGINQIWVFVLSRGYYPVQVFILIKVFDLTVPVYP